MSCFRVEVTLSRGSFVSPCEADVCQELASHGAGDTCVLSAGITDQGKPSGMPFCWGWGRLGLQEPYWWSSRGVPHPLAQLAARRGAVVGCSGV